MIPATRGLIAVLAVVLLSGLVAGCAETRLMADSGLGDPPEVYAHLRQMPLIETPAAGTASGPLVVLYTGDNGWAKFDHKFADRLAAAGAPVVGVSSLVYFLKGRTPKGAAADLTSLIAHYTRKWDRRDVVLIGYSYGGDDLPLIAQALSPSVLSRVRLLVLISPADEGDLTFRGASWFDLMTRDARPIAPALATLGDLPILCISSDHDPRQACDRLSGPRLMRSQIPGGHHYVGHASDVADLILKTAASAAARQ
jgi:type IV secretory pathway VirJ component